MQSSLKNLESLKIEPKESLHKNFFIQMEKLIKEAYSKFGNLSLISIKVTHFIKAASKPIG